RRFGDIMYERFFNPMWSLLGDAGGRAPGSYYYHGSDVDSRFWYMWDQVLVRPSLLDRLGESDVEILTGYAGVNFLDSDGVPRKADVSDHLPVIFTLGLEEAR